MVVLHYFYQLIYVVLYCFETKEALFLYILAEGSLCYHIYFMVYKLLILANIDLFRHIVRLLFAFIFIFTFIFLTYIKTLFLDIHYHFLFIQSSLKLKYIYHFYQIVFTGLTVCI